MEPLNKCARVGNTSVLGKQSLCALQDHECGDCVVELLENSWPDFFPVEEDYLVWEMSDRRKQYFQKTLCLIPKHTQTSPVLLKRITDILHGKTSHPSLSKTQKMILCSVAIIVSFAHRNVKEVASSMEELWRTLADPDFMESFDEEGFTEIVLHFLMGVTELDNKSKRTEFSRKTISDVLKGMLDSLEAATVECFDVKKWTSISLRRIALLVNLNAFICDFLWDHRKRFPHHWNSDAFLDTSRSWLKRFARFFFKVLQSVKNEHVMISTRVFHVLYAFFRRLLLYEAFDVENKPWNFDEVYVEALNDLGSWCLDKSVPRIIPHLLLVIFSLKADREESKAKKLANNPVFPELVCVTLKYQFESNPCPLIKSLIPRYDVAFRIYVNLRTDGCRTLLNSTALDYVDLDWTNNEEKLFEDQVMAGSIQEAMSAAILQHCHEQEVFGLLLIHHFFLRVQKRFYAKTFPHHLCCSLYQEFAMQLIEEDPLIAADLLLLTSLTKGCADCKEFQRRGHLVVKTVSLFANAEHPDSHYATRLHYATRGLAFSIEGTSHPKFKTSPGTRTLCHYRGLSLRKIPSCVKFLCGEQEEGVCILGDRQQLSSCLPYFTAMFEREFIESESPVVFLPWMEHPSLAPVLFHYLHACRLSNPYPYGMCPVLEKFFDANPAQTDLVLKLGDFLGFEELAKDLQKHLRNLAEKKPEKFLMLFEATHDTDMEDVIMPEVLHTVLSSVEVHEATRKLTSVINDNQDVYNTIVKSLIRLLDRK